MEVSLIFGSWEREIEIDLWYEPFTAQKMKFSIKDFFS